MSYGTFASFTTIFCRVCRHNPGSDGLEPVRVTAGHDRFRNAARRESAAHMGGDRAAFRRYQKIRDDHPQSSRMEQGRLAKE